MKSMGLTDEHSTSPALQVEPAPPVETPSSDAYLWRAFASILQAHSGKRALASSWGNEYDEDGSTRGLIPDEPARLRLSANRLGQQGFPEVSLTQLPYARVPVLVAGSPEATSVNETACLFPQRHLSP